MVVNILRGIPGSGKSTLAESMVENNEDSIICSADEYFDKYDVDFNYKTLEDAQKWCFKTFKDSIENEVGTIIISNTNTKKGEVERYRDYAIDKGYKVFVLTVENWHGGKDKHNVQDKTLAKMEIRLRSSLKLR